MVKTIASYWSIEPNGENSMLTTVQRTALISLLLSRYFCYHTPIILDTTLEKNGHRWLKKVFFSSPVISSFLKHSKRKFKFSKEQKKFWEFKVHFTLQLKWNLKINSQVKVLYFHICCRKEMVCKKNKHGSSLIVVSSF